MKRNHKNQIHRLVASTLLVGAVTLTAIATIFFALSVTTPAAAQGRTNLVLAFYYAWYNPQSFGPGKTAFQPPKPYLSGDPQVIRRHVNEARAAGIDGFIQSWYGPAEGVTNGNFQTLLDVAAANGFKAAVDFEPATFLSNNDERANALQSLLATHANHPAYLKVDGKPVIFFWANWAYSIDDWATIRDIADPYRSSIWIAEGARTEYLQVFDGLHLYNIAWSANPNGIASTWAANTRAAAETYGAFKYWVATAMPGFDDRHLGRGDASVYRDRAGGAYYQNSFASAASSNPDLLVITSFNEWAEGSNIEPSTAFGNSYLDLTAQLVSGYKSGGVAPPPPLPESTSTPAPAEGAGNEPPTEGDDVLPLAQAATDSPQPSATSFALPTAQADGRVIYEVVEGDTLSAIAFRFGISLEELYALNNLDESSLLGVGQPLVLGFAAGDAATESPLGPLPSGVVLGEEGDLIYEVQEGDTLIAIAVQYQLSIEEILALNPAVDEDSLLQLGQAIVVGQRRQPEAVGGSTDFPSGTASPTVAPEVTLPATPTAPVSITGTPGMTVATATQALAINEPTTRLPEPTAQESQATSDIEPQATAGRSIPTWLIIVVIFITVTAAGGAILLFLGTRQSPRR